MVLFRFVNGNWIYLQLTTEKYIKTFNFKWDVGPPGIEPGSQGHQPRMIPFTLRPHDFPF